MNNRILLTLVLVLTTSLSHAYDFIEGGIAYNVLKDGTLSVTFRQENLARDMNQKLTYRGDVAIPSTVVHDGKTYKVSEIGKYAFYDSQGLSSLKISEGIKRIQYNGISYVNIKSLHLPASLTELIPGAIFGCYYLSDITVSSQNRQYLSEGNCIYNKNKTQLRFVSPTLTTYEFPPTVKSVVDYAFNWSQINKIIIPSTLTHIGGKAFSMNNIETVICKKGLKRLKGSEPYNKDLDLPPWAYVQ